MSERRPCPPPGRDRFLELDLPERFMLQCYENGRWTEEAVAPRSRFTRQPDGSYAGDAGGSPIWFRCVCGHGDYFIHMDGGEACITTACSRSSAMARSCCPRAALFIPDPRYDERRGDPRKAQSSAGGGGLG
jgi:hypothetical protein